MDKVVPSILTQYLNRLFCCNIRSRIRNTLLNTVFLIATAASHQSFAQIVINEVDYDNLSTDNAEFIELKNTGSVAILLDGYEVQLVNGGSSPPSAYRTYSLPSISLSPDEYYVICANTDTVANCDLDVSPDSNLIQNGAPDAIALFDGTTLVDTVSYEGETADGFTEGDAVSTANSDVNATAFLSVSRTPDGSDTDNNSNDFALVCLTPGESNASASTNCDADSTPPVITPSVVGTLGNNDWYVSDIEVSFSVTDSESAISSSSGCDTTTVSADTSGVTFTCDATSDGGTSSESVTVKRDATPPDVTISSPSNSANYVQGESVAAGWVTSDATSGIATESATSANGDAIDTASTGTKSFSVSAEDNAGNTTSVTHNYSVDPPGTGTVTLIKNVINNNGGTAGSNDFGLSINGTTVNSGDSLGFDDGTSVAINEVGLAGYTFVEISGDANCPAALGGTITVSAGDNITCTITNDDDAPIDTTPPAIVAQVVGTLGDNDWYTSDLTVSWSVTDPHSSVTVDSGCSTETVTADTDGMTFTCQASSDGGTSSDSITVKRDTTAPVLTLNSPPDGASYNLDDTVIADWSATDSVAGIALATGDTASGGNIDTASTGGKTYTVTATDDAGNSNTVTHNYTVVSASTPEADLSINKVDSVDPVLPGNTLVYTITVNNAGPDLAENVVVTDTLPAGVTFVASSNCINDPTGVPTCELGDITSGGSASYTIEVTVDASTSGVITNTASVSADTTDPDTGDNSTSENTTISVVDMAMQQISASSDDAEQRANRKPVLVGSDLGVLPTQMVGMRFENLMIPAGQIIADAYIQFTAEEDDSSTTSATIWGENVDDAQTFARVRNDMSDRPLTAADVDWTVAPWTMGDAGVDQRTPNVAAIIQEIVNRPGWQSGNAIALMVQGHEGRRSAFSVDNDPAAAPKLVVNFTSGMFTVVTPVITPDSGSYIAPIDVDITTSTPGATIYYTTDGSEPTMGDTACGCPFPVSSDVTIKAKAFLDGYNDSATVSEDFTFSAPPAGTLTLDIQQGRDDVEERPNGRITMFSNDLEMTTLSGAQTIGLRYQDVGIPAGATITYAYLVFTAKDSHSDATTLMIDAEAIADAPMFQRGSSNLNNVTDRVTSGTPATWNVPAWTAEDGSFAQISPDLTTVIQSVIDQPGWASGNALALIISGSGLRSAYTYDGDPAKAPTLHIEFSASPP
ncbi:MAG: chitobiase/beta-hexosaminidase C-terminal domain-containing protein [Pseudomonadota bacterium]